jgi:hypothetical protein
LGENLQVASTEHQWNWNREAYVRAFIALGG